MNAYVVGIFLTILCTTSEAVQVTCGDQTFNSLSPDSWTCCAGKLYHKEGGIFLACCEKKCFNPAKQHCCQGNIFPRFDINTACCGAKSYQRGLHSCCDRKVIDLRTQDCCRNTPYNRKTQACCQGVVSQMDLTLGERPECCGTKSYNPAHNTCCAGEIVPKVAGEFTKCCVTKPYDRRRNTCCDQKIIAKVDGKDKCCAGIMIDTKVDVCCGGTILARLYGAQTACCRIGGKQFSDLAGKNSVANENEVRALLGGVHVTYDKKESLCCSGNLVFRKFGADAACCGKESYNTRTQMCCMDKIHRRSVGKSERCCNKELFDRNRHLCCRGVLHSIAPQERPHKYCCNEVVYDRRKAHCNEKKAVSIYQCEDPIYLYGARGNKIQLRY